MKIGISFSPDGNTYERYGKDKYSVIKQHGYDAVDYNLSHTELELYSVGEKELKRIINTEKTALHHAQLQLSQIHGPWRYPPQDHTNEDREERLSKMKRAVDIASLFACRHLVIHPIMPYGTQDLKSGKEAETWALNLDFFEDLVSCAEQNDVVICLENMPMRHFSIAKPEKILEFVQEFHSDHLGICLDTGHAAIFPDLKVGDEVRRLDSYLKVFHIHDNMGDKDAHQYPQSGIIDWVDFIHAVEEIGFSGVLSLETAPSSKLENEAFEKESIYLCEMFRQLVLGAARK